MSSSDSRMFEELVARVERLERRVNDITERILPKDASGELYGQEVDHTADRAERAALAKRGGATQLPGSAERPPRPA